MQGLELHAQHERDDRRSVAVHRMNAEHWLARLVDVDPWTHSREGLDDGCLFCGSSNYLHNGTASQARYYHRPDCVWISACRFLKIKQTHHFVEPLPANPYRGECKLCDRWTTLASHQYHVSDEYKANQAAFDARVAEIGFWGAMDESMRRHYSNPWAFVKLEAPRGGINFVSAPLINPPLYDLTKANKEETEPPAVTTTAAFCAPVGEIPFPADYTPNLEEPTDDPFSE